MSMELIWVVSLLGFVINCFILYHIIKSAARSAMEEVLAQFVQKDTTAQELQRIRELLEKAQKPAVLAPPPASLAVDSIPEASDPTSAIVREGAHLIVIDEKNSRCSVCGQEQRPNRTVCYTCGARFTTTSETP